MNPDSSSSEINAPLPEVPPIMPTTPTPEPSTPPAAPPVHRAPVINAPFTPPSGIVSDIRRPHPVAAPSVVVATHDPAPLFGTGQLPQEVKTPKKRSKLPFIVGLVIGGIVLLVGIAAVLLVFVFTANGKIVEPDLVSTTNDATTYLRPKQWQAINVGDATGYGNKLAKDGKSSALIAATKGSYLGVLSSPSDTQLTTFRDAILKTVSQSYAESLIKKYGLCDSTSNVKSTENTAKNTRSYGIFRITGNCSKDNSSYTVVYSTLLGNDGYIRAITFMATETNWKQNEAVFNKMIDSADQE